MKKFTQIINEERGSDITEQWLNDEKPVMTKDGRQAVVLEIDMSVVPNIIKGEVKMGDTMFAFEWEDNGKCVKAVDRNGSIKSPDDNDKLVCAI